MLVKPESKLTPSRQEKDETRSQEHKLELTMVERKLVLNQLLTR